MIKKYRVIYNLGYKDENIIYLDSLTSKRMSQLKNTNGYVIELYNKEYRRYLVNNYKLNTYQLALYNYIIKALGDYCNARGVKICG